MEENLKKNRSGRMSKTQKEYLIWYLEGHRAMLDAKVSPQQIEPIKNLWRDLGEKLNNLSGAKKNIRQWKDVSMLFLYLCNISLCSKE